MSSFLSAHFKGRYTLETKVEGERVEKTRKDLWVKLDGDRSGIIVNDIGGAEHKGTANWFYEVFKQWDLKDDHPVVSQFEGDQGFHVDARHTYTYSLADIADELYFRPEGCPAPIPDDALYYFVTRGATGGIEWDEIYPEALWAFEHIRVPLGLHVKLLEMYNKESPYTGPQVRLMHSLYAHHRPTGLADFLCAAMEPIYRHIGVEPE